MCILMLIGGVTDLAFRKHRFRCERVSLNCPSFVVYLSRVSKKKEKKRECYPFFWTLVGDKLGAVSIVFKPVDSRFEIVDSLTRNKNEIAQMVLHPFRSIVLRTMIRLYTYLKLNEIGRQNTKPIYSFKIFGSNSLD